MGSGAPVRTPVAQNRSPFTQRPYYGRGYRGVSVFAYPVYVGGYGGYYGDYNDSGSNYAPAYSDPSFQQQAPPAPPVVINQYFSGAPMAPPPEQQDDPNIHMYQQPSAAPAGYSPQPAADSRTYLIAYKDHSVYTALAYWIEGSTLHYVTTENTHNQSELNLIDVDFTRKLNADRSMPFNVTAQ